MFFNSSWALFSSTDKDEKKCKYFPYSFFGKEVHFEEYERKVLEKLRKWVQTSFQQNRMLSNQFITNLNHLNAIQQDEKDPMIASFRKQLDFDLQVKVVQLVKLDAYCSEMKCVDNSGEIWNCQVMNMKYKDLKEGQYIRIRQATIQNHVNYAKTFGIKHHGNIMTLPDQCKIASEMIFDEEKVMKQHDMEMLATNSLLLNPVIVSNVALEAAGDCQVVSLNQLKELYVNKPESEIDGATKYRIRVSVNSVN